MGYTVNVNVMPDGFVMALTRVEEIMDCTPHSLSQIWFS